MTVLVVNLDAQPVGTVTLSVDLALTEPVTAEVLFEQRTVMVSVAGELRDVLDGFGSRAYRLHLNGTIAASHRRPAPDRAQGRHDNLVLNPSFELQSSVSRPDSFLYTYGNGGSALADPTYAA